MIRKPRFRIRTLMLATGLVAVGIAIVQGCLFPKYWEETRLVPIRVRVSDDATGKPIQGALVKLDDDEEELPPGARSSTSASGLAKVERPCFSRGVTRGILTWGEVSFKGSWIEISHPDKESMRIPVREIAGASRSTWWATPPVFNVRMPRSSPIARLSGSYSWGNGYVGKTLELSATGRFRIGYWSDTGPFDETTCEGTADVSNFVLNLNCTGSGEHRHSEELTLIPVRWGTLIYMIESTRITEFCNAVNLGWEPHDSQMPTSFFFRELVKDQPITGLPELPPVYRRMLLAAPISGRVVALNGKLKARVSLGAQHGVYKGMALLVVEFDRWPAAASFFGAPAQERQCEVVEVRESDCTVKFESDPKRTPPKVGDVVHSQSTESIRIRAAMQRMRR